MQQLIRLSEITSVQCGTLGTLMIVGHSDNGDLISVKINVADVSRVAPALLEGATIATRYEWPAEGTAIEGGYVAVCESHPSAAKDTKDALLRVHTDGGTLRLLFPPESAIACGIELQRLGSAAKATDSELRH